MQVQSTFGILPLKMRYSLFSFIKTYLWNILTFAVGNKIMRLSFTYDKKKVLQALRYHFIWQNEIRIFLILIIVFDIISAILYLIGKIHPEPFLLGSLIWLLFIVSFWFILPNSIYRKSETFKDSFVVDFGNNIITLQNKRGYVEWEWKQLIKFFESPNFFHFYFSQKSFFLLPKDNMNDDFKHDLRTLLHEKISSQK
jgi:YcxB-like protein